MTEITFGAIVGENFRKLRLESGATLESVAKRARLYGIRWSTARVAELERGTLAISAQLFVMIAQIAGDVTGQRVTLAQLLAGDGLADVAGLPVKRRALRDLFNGYEVDLVNVTAQPEFANMRLERASESEPLGLAEERAAKTLGISAEEFETRALSLWGKSLTAERDRRAPSDASPQLRGHLTRELLKELRATFDSGATEEHRPQMDRAYKQPLLNDFLGAVRVEDDLEPAPDYFDETIDTN